MASTTPHVWGCMWERTPKDGKKNNLMDKKKLVTKQGSPLLLGCTGCDGRSFVSNRPEECRRGTMSVRGLQFRAQWCEAGGGTDRVRIRPAPGGSTYCVPEALLSLTPPPPSCLVWYANQCLQCGPSALPVASASF